jgi:hypothetical protein
MQLNTHESVVIGMRRKTKGPWGTDLGYRFKTKELGTGDKVCIVNGSNHRCGLVDHYLSLCFGRDSRVVIWRVFCKRSLSLKVETPLSS